jgi:energy-coupling factor transporter ATP-binding protein EcfA2
MHELAAAIGVCFENPSSQLSGVTGTVYEEVAFGPMNLGIPRDEVIARTEQALDAVAIRALADREPSRLSGGQMQLVAIAGLLAMRPRHLVLDEPTAQLDPAGTLLVSDTLAALAAGGASILIAEQKTELLARICSRIVVLDGGRVVIDGPAADVFDDPRLIDLGVQPTPEVRLRRLAAEAGVTEMLAAAVGGGAGPGNR